MKEAVMQHEPVPGWLNAAARRPAAELLACPPSIQNKLNSSAQCIDFQPGDVVFRQSSACKGLYLILSGLFQRNAERHESRLTLGLARPGELLELAASLGNSRHSCTLTALIEGSVVLLPADALTHAFLAWPRLRMQLLEELAREVSRGYHSSRLVRAGKPRRQSFSAGARAIQHRTPP
jgi:CRP-like cAMP-binding protein